MGIPFAIADQIAALTLRHGLRGSCLTLGRQDIQITMGRLGDILVSHGLMERNGNGPLVGPTPIVERIAALIRQGQHINRSPDLQHLGWISDRMFFAALGFDFLSSVDGNSFDGATEVFDLNEEGLRAHLRRSYDLIVDCGTLEHCFDIRTVLKNIIETLSVGGKVMHVSPSNNYVDHGFYQFSPTFYHDFYSANGFRILSMKFYRHTVDVDGEPWKSEDYSPGSLDERSFGGLDSALYQTMICAEKLETSTWHRKPIQFRYKKLWR